MGAMELVRVIVLLLSVSRPSSHTFTLTWPTCLGGIGGLPVHTYSQETGKYQLAIFGSYNPSCRSYVTMTRSEYDTRSRRWILIEPYIMKERRIMVIGRHMGSRHVSNMTISRSEIIEIWAVSTVSSRIGSGSLGSPMNAGYVISEITYFHHSGLSLIIYANR
jgi:hypothetical protein